MDLVHYYHYYYKRVYWIISGTITKYKNAGIIQQVSQYQVFDIKYFLRFFHKRRLDVPGTFCFCLNFLAFPIILFPFSSEKSLFCFSCINVKLSQVEHNLQTIKFPLRWTIKIPRWNTGQVVIKLPFKHFQLCCRCKLKWIGIYVGIFSVYWNLGEERHTGTTSDITVPVGCHKIHALCQAGYSWWKLWMNSNWVKGILLQGS